MEGAIAKAREIADDDAGRVHAAAVRQPREPARSTRATTAREILAARWAALSIDAFVAGVGTGGTVSGVGPSCVAR